MAEDRDDEERLKYIKRRAEIVMADYDNQSAYRRLRERYENDEEEMMKEWMSRTTISGW